VICGFGSGLILPSLTIGIQNVFSKEEVGVATASLQFFKNLGGSVGPAVLGAVLTTGITNSAAVSPLQKMSDAFHPVFWVCLGVSVGAALLTLCMKQVAIKKDEKNTKDSVSGEEAVIPAQA